MQKYKVLKNRAVFAIGKRMYDVRSGDVIELDENHITTQALLAKKSIELTADSPTNESVDMSGTGDESGSESPMGDPANLSFPGDEIDSEVPKFRRPQKSKTSKTE